MVKRIGITFLIPISLAVCGVLIILSSSWNLITQTLNLGVSIFAEPKVNISKVQYTINDEKVYRPDIGTKFGVLKIPELNINKEVFHGDNEDQLRLGIGHYAGSTLPGEGGNCVVAGHRDTVFRPLQYIKKGQEVIFETDYGIFKYNVSDIRITNQFDETVTAPSSTEKLTMYTCHPFNFIGKAPNRFIVTCDLVSSEKAKEGEK